MATSGGSGSMLAQAYLRISVDRRHLNGELRSPLRMFRSAVSTMAGTAAGILAASGIQSGIRSVIDLMHQLGSSFIENNVAIEQYEASLTTLLHSASRAASMIQEI